METSLPKWNARLDAHRPDGVFGFSDLQIPLRNHFLAHAAAEQFLGPYNARQRNSQLPYCAPSRESIRQLVKQGGMNDLSYSAFISGLIKFCEQHKGLRALPTSHPSTLHSIQLPLGAFEMKSSGADTLIHIAGVHDPILVKGLRNKEDIKFIIARPKLSKLGTASASNWEVLFFRAALGYIPDWTDSTLNPKYSGTF